MQESNEQIVQTAKENDIPCPEELFEKARLVHERMMALREKLDQSVFAGASKDGLLRIDMHGDGRPQVVTFNIPLDPAEKQFFEKEILAALADAYQCRISQLAQGLEAIQNELGVGPDFQMPF